jgi:hypothetical protein
VINVSRNIILLENNETFAACHQVAVMTASHSLHLHMAVVADVVKNVSGIYETRIFTTVFKTPDQ